MRRRLFIPAAAEAPTNVGEFGYGYAEGQSSQTRGGMIAPAGGRKRPSRGSPSLCFSWSNSLPTSSPASNASGHCLSCSSIGSLRACELAMRASSSLSTRSVRVQPSRHPDLRVATVQALHFFLSFAVISFRSMLRGIETVVAAIQSVTTSLSEGVEPPARGHYGFAERRSCSVSTLGFLAQSCFS